MRLLFQLAPGGGEASSSRGLARSASSRGVKAEGPRNVVFSWEPKGNFLASSGSTGVVSIWDRHGESVAEITLSSSAPVLAIDWDKDGESIAVVQEGQPLHREVQRLDTGLKDPCFIKWSGVGPQLVVGTVKGNVLVYNRLSRKKVPVLGKHPRRITCGAWSQKNKLALGSEDSTLTLSNDVGDTLEQTELKHAPREMCFAVQKGHAEETHLSVNMAGRSLLLYDLKDPDNPLELAFQQRYGTIVAHEWFGDGLILLGFSEGFLVVISTHISEIGEELFSGRFHHKALVDVAYSPTLSFAAVAGDTGVKLVEMTTFKDLKREAIATDPALGPVEKVTWSPDGHILTASTRKGYVLAFLARMPSVHNVFGSTVAYLSSLREISVLRRNEPPHVFPVHLEPSFVAVAPFHVAVGMNNVVMYYRYAASSGAFLEEAVRENEQEYLGKVNDICLNETSAAVLSGGRVSFHEIVSVGFVSPQRKTFPEEEAQPPRGAVTCIALTSALLIYGTEAGFIEFYSCAEQGGLDGAGLRHAGGAIASLSPNGAGTRVAFVDAQRAAFVYNPISSEVTAFPAFPTTTAAGASVRIMWDTRDAHVVLVSDGAELHTYAYAPCTIKGALMSKLGPVDISEEGEVSMAPSATPIQQGLHPICSHDGQVTCQIASSGSITFIRCPSYDHRDAADPSPAVVFCQSLALLRLRDAWPAAARLANRAYWLALSGKAMELLDVPLAIRVYRELGDAGMVMGLERIAHVEEKNLLAGHVLLLFAQYNSAADLFLSSSRPTAALDMRRDLLHWDQALKLAHTLDPHQEPAISVSFAQQLEFKGDFEPALKMFEKAQAMEDNDALRRSPADEKEDDDAPPLSAVCRAGIARCTLRLGDLRRGLSYVRESKDEALCRDCAAILEALAQHSEAASLYELAGEYDKAAGLYIRKLNYAQAAAIMDRVTTPKLHAQYAKACEQAGKFKEAVEAYETAHDTDSAVRLYLSREVNEPERAFEMVRATGSSEGAQLVAKFCHFHGDFRGAIEFLLMAQRSEEAFALAQAQDQMEVYTSVIGAANMAPDDALNVAQHYEAQHDLGRAGTYYAHCGQYARALKLFLKCGEKEVHKAIDLVGKARSDALTHTLIDFLMGDTDGVPKDPNHVYRLYVALGNFPQAAKTAVIIAKQEQDMGNYKDAHAILYETIHQLEVHGVYVPQSLRHPFILLQSYMLVRKMIKRNDHASAARMLLRVAKNISKFPTHTIQLLTSTVVECQRAGLKKPAYDYATMLMRPEYRSNIEPKFKRKIEAMIRRPPSAANNDDDDDENEALSPCPISGPSDLETNLFPRQRRLLEELPMCVVTGRHMERGDWTICPNSKMPALYSAYVAFLTTTDDDTKTDPVTGRPITLDQIPPKLSPDDVDKYLETWRK